ncbi:MAG: cell division protein FtsZ [Gammaproteobacteria bacterium]|nr:MAG: cell division protein FtsZ [Gammaproteobacteria bacterium]
MNTLLADTLSRSDTWLGHGITGNHDENALPTGFAELDTVLHGGGLPLGGCIEYLSDSNGLGSMGLFLPVMEALSQENRWMMFIAPPHTPYAPLLEARQIDSSKILLVHPRNRANLLWCIEQALSSGTCSSVFAWLGNDSYRYRELHKLQLAASRSDTLSVLFRPQRAANSSAPASLRLQSRAYREIHVLKQRGGPQHINVTLSSKNDKPHQPQLWELPSWPPQEQAANDYPCAV